MERAENEPKWTDVSHNAENEKNEDYYIGCV